MRENPMDLTRFKACSDAYGASRRHWPPHEHALYDRFASTVEGAAILADAERTDRFLDGLEVAEPDPRIMGQVAAAGTPGWRRFAKPVAALAASAVLGFVVGFAQARSGADVPMHLLLGPQDVLEIGL
jgi:hypothetical protein